MADYKWLGAEKKKTAISGQSNNTQGGTEYGQMKINNDFNMISPKGVNQHNPNIITDKPYNSHIE